MARGKVVSTGDLPECTEVWPEERWSALVTCRSVLRYGQRKGIGHRRSHVSGIKAHHCSSTDITAKNLITHDHSKHHNFLHILISWSNAYRTLRILLRAAGLR